MRRRECAGASVGTNAIHVLAMEKHSGSNAEATTLVSQGKMFPSSAGGRPRLLNFRRSSVVLC